MSEAFLPVTGSEQPEAANIVIFGATGDLTKRKLLPALAQMHHWNLLGARSRIIGVVRGDFTPARWRDHVREALRQYFPEALDPHAWRRIEGELDVAVGDLADPKLYQRLARRLHMIDGRKNALFYLAIPPSWYACVAKNLREAGLASEQEGFRRIVIEKPFGMDLASARALNATLQQQFDESQIYRIDHYLGKESVQNLLAFRFGNAVLEPLWNRNYIDHVQITVAESLGVEYRAGYYETSGALRDMIQSHLIQVMSLVAMEPPVSLDADAIRDEKVKVMRSVRQIRPEAVARHAIRAQYAAGTIAGKPVRGYRDEPGVARDSVTETFAALKLYVDNWRWQGVPFLLRTGKRLPERISEICIRFKEPPHTLFYREEDPVCNNELIFRLQPNEGMTLSMNAKQPGFSTHLRGIALHAPYAMHGTSAPDAYETLLYDALRGEAALFLRADGVEACWRIVTPVLEAWAGAEEIASYRAGSWEVPGLECLMSSCEGCWREFLA